MVSGADTVSKTADVPLVDALWARSGRPIRLVEAIPSRRLVEAPDIPQLVDLLRIRLLDGIVRHKTLLDTIPVAAGVGKEHREHLPVFVSKSSRFVDGEAEPRRSCVAAKVELTEGARNCDLETVDDGVRFGAFDKVTGHAGRIDDVSPDEVRACYKDIHWKWRRTIAVEGGSSEYKCIAMDT